METTRLLLNSDKNHNGGIGSHSNKLGRYYMGHISGSICKIKFNTDPEDTVYGFDKDKEGIYVRRRFSFSRGFLHKEELPNIVGWLSNPKLHDARHGNGILSFAYLVLSSPLGKYFASEAIRNSLVKDVKKQSSTMSHLSNVLRDAGNIALFIPAFGIRRYICRRKIPGFCQKSASNEYNLHYHGEQVPNPNSTVTLTNDYDELGMRKIKIDLCYTNQNIECVIRAHNYWDEYLRKHHKGHLKYSYRNIEDSVWKQAKDGFHQIGTTRMSIKAEDGVVDENCRVHGFNDLFVASSSTFVTSSQANPTFMIVAFAIRLSDHIKTTFKNKL